MQADWNEPVVVRLHTQESQSIESAREAMDSLMLWPWRDGKSYKKAVRACLFALVGEKPPEKARKAFLNAARKADYLDPKYH